MGEPALRVIAQELVTSIKTNVSVDWMHRDAARARMRVFTFWFPNRRGAACEECAWDQTTCEFGLPPLGAGLSLL